MDYLAIADKKIKMNSLKVYEPIASVPEFVASSVRSHMDIWDTTVADYTDLDLQLSKFDVSEPDADGFIDKIISHLNNNYGESIGEEDIKEAFRKVFRCEPGVLFSNGYKEATRDFLKKARAFDPNITVEEIYQALRNVWIANSIQHLSDIPIISTDPVFAYSMLYPYTDNLLDDAAIDHLQKQQFNRRFRKRLDGQMTEPENTLEATIFRLVSLIEQRYPRKDFPGVYQSLLAIHSGQEKSILLNGKGCSSLNDITRISFEKGGTSVLADGYLVSGNLNYEEAEFMMGYGIFLQLLDDLQDVQDDLKEHQNTIFTYFHKHGRVLDKPTVQMMDFILKIIAFGEIIFPEKKDFLKIIQNCSIVLANRSIQKNKALFSKGFLGSMEKKTGFSGTFYSKQENRFKSMDKAFIETQLNRFLHNDIFSDIK
jgi:hypothetical protein